MGINIIERGRERGDSGSVYWNFITFDTVCFSKNRNPYHKEKVKEYTMTKLPHIPTHRRGKYSFKLGEVKKEFKMKGKN